MKDSRLSLDEFDFEYPEDLVAQEPVSPRGASRLLTVSAGGHMEATQFARLGDFLKPHDVLVLNVTRVLKARVAALKPTGGKVELLFERQVELDEDGRPVWLSLARPAKGLKPGSFVICDEQQLEIGERRGMFVEVTLPMAAEAFFSKHGALPLPPYIQRKARDEDDVSYQPVFARELGAVAAPTASLHFTESQLAELRAQGVEIAEVVLHVGSGTFLPVRREHAADIREHEMHRERYEVSDHALAKISEAKAKGGRVIAVGTTAVRALESYASSGLLSGDTSLFIYPGFEFQLVDAMITNFHQPRTTLLMMVSAFAGTDVVLEAYKFAIQAKFRLFSYGDAMFLERAMR